MSADAQALVKKAFGEWSGIESDIVNHIVGLAFTEVAWTEGQEIQVHWHTVNSKGNHGFYGAVSPNPTPATGTKWDTENGTPVTLIFESDISWSYGVKTKTSADRYHFYTVALHETGHVIGLDSQPDQQDIMFDDGFNPGPNGPCFDNLTDSNSDAIHGARDLYMIELPPEQAGMLKAGTGVISAQPAVAPVNTPAIISITNIGPMPIELLGWSVRRPDGRVDRVVYTPPLEVVLPGANVVVTVYLKTEVPGLYMVWVDYDPVAQTTFQRYVPYVGGEMTLYGSFDSVDNSGLLIPYIHLTSTIVIAAVATAIYVKHKKKKQ